MGFFNYAAGAAALMVVALLPYLLLGLAIPYAVLRLRETREGQADSQLGLKVALSYFFSLSLLIILVGLTIIVVDLLPEPGVGRGGGRNDFPNPAQRVGLAMLLAGLLFVLVYFVALVAMTTEPFASPVRRTFLGWRFAVHGLVIMVAVTGLFIVLFQPRDVSADESRRFLLGTLIVWGPSWIVHFVLFRLSSPWAWQPGKEPRAFDDENDLLPPYRR